MWVTFLHKGAVGCLRIFKGCSFSSGLAVHLVLALPSWLLWDTPSLFSKATPALYLVIPNHTLVSSPTPKHSGVLSHPPTLRTYNRCCWLYVVFEKLLPYGSPHHSRAHGSGTAAALPRSTAHSHTKGKKGSCRALTFKNCGVTRRTVATRQICSSVADLKARAIADSKPLQEGVGTRHNQIIYLRSRGRRVFFSC